MAFLMLRKIDADLWRRVLARAAAEGRGKQIEPVALRLLELYAERGLDVLERTANTEPTTPEHP